MDINVFIHLIPMSPHYKEIKLRDRKIKKLTEVTQLVGNDDRI
jgi:hypothetical protein